MSENAAYEAFKEPFRRLLEARQERDRTKKAAARAEAEYRTREAELFEQLQDAGIRGRLEFDFGGDLGVAKFQRRSTKRGRIIDKETAIKALRARGLDHIVSVENIAMRRLNELVRDTLESKGELPDGVDFYSENRISISRK